MKTYSKIELGRALFHRWIGRRQLELLIEQAQDHGYIVRCDDLVSFTVTARGVEFSERNKPLPKEPKKRVHKPKKKAFEPVHLKPHERKFSGLFSTVWNAIGFDVRDASEEELEEMTPDVIAEVILDCSYIETYCDRAKDKALIAELRALPYEEQKRLATGENFGF
jgi:hypothetical protein